MNLKNKIIISCFSFLLLIGGCFLLTKKENKKQEENINTISATVLKHSNSSITVQDNNNGIYTFKANNIDLDNGANIVLKYSGIINKTQELQDNKIVSYEVKSVSTLDDAMPSSWNDSGIFSNFYTLAYNKLKTLSLDEKIGQLFLVRYPNNNQTEILKNNQFGGYIFFEKDFQNKTRDEVINMMKESQNVSKIPILTAVDEEGGNVVRISSNPLLAQERFKSSQELYNSGGFAAIREDTINKSKLLYDLGLNLNLAPVADVSTSNTDYIYHRSFGQNSSLTSEYVKNVIEASKGLNVSYTLKHFPGYGNNSDTHAGASIDNRSYENIVNNDLPPFKEGIKAGAEAVLISHNTVVNIDSNNPSSLSPSVHNILRNDLDFTGIIITDDLNMAALDNIDDKSVKALLAGNDLIIISDYETALREVKNALNNGTLNEDLINKIVFRNLAWKYYKGLLYENQK